MHNIQQLHKVDLFNHITDMFVGSKPKKKTHEFPIHNCTLQMTQI